MLEFIERLNKLQKINLVAISITVVVLFAYVLSIQTSDVLLLKVSGFDSLAIAPIVIPVIDYWAQTEIINCNLDRIDICLQNLSVPNFPILLHFGLDHSLLVNFLLAT